MRDLQPGDKVTSIAIQATGVGTVERVSFDHVYVRWADNRWSQERLQDLIFIGNAKIAPFAFAPNEGVYTPLPADETPSKEPITITFDDSYQDPFHEGIVPRVVVDADLSSPIPNILTENLRIYEQQMVNAMIPGAPIPLITKGVIF